MNFRFETSVMCVFVYVPHGVVPNCVCLESPLNIVSGGRKKLWTIELKCSKEIFYHAKPRNHWKDYKKWIFSIGVSAQHNLKFVLIYMIPLGGVHNLIYLIELLLLCFTLISDTTLRDVIGAAQSSSCRCQQPTANALVHSFHLDALHPNKFRLFWSLWSCVFLVLN